MPRRLTVPGFPIWIGLFLMLSALAPAAAPWPAHAQEATDDSVYRRFDEISAMRANGEFDRAVEVLRGIIAEPKRPGSAPIRSDGLPGFSDDILRRAHNELVFTILSKRSIASGDEARRALDAEARTLAGDALRRFPDLIADRHYFPVEINLIYDDLRETMFGEVHIETSPHDSRVQIGDAFDGTSPVSIAYFPVGSYRLLVSHDGYAERADTLAVIPGGLVQREISLSKRRGKKWWLTRIVPTVAATALIAVGVSNNGGDGDDEGEGGDLSEPPPPPAR